MKIFILALALAGFSTGAIAQDTPVQTPLPERAPNYVSNQVLHPEWFIKVTDWSFFSAARVGMLSSVVIENTADIAYKDIQVQLSMYTTSPPAVGQTIATNLATLPVTLPPKSKKKYIKGGMPVGGGSPNYQVSDIQVISATPITK